MSASLANLRQWLSWHYWAAGAGAPLFDEIAGASDDVIARLRQAMRVRLPSVAPVDALQEIAYNENLDPPANRMTTTALRDYLGDPWGKWKRAGTRQRIYDELALLGYPNTEIVSYRDLVDAGAPAATTFGGQSACWFLVIKKPNLWDISGKWGLPPVGSGAVWGAAPFPWGSTARWSEIEEIRRLIRKWKPAGSSCRYIVAWLRVSIFGVPTAMVVWPVHEWWEYDANGAARSFYNSAYDRE